MFFRKPKPVSGFPVYTAEDFEEHFGLPSAQSKAIYVAHHALITETHSRLADFVKRSGRDLAKTSSELHRWLGIEKNCAAGVARFLANTASALGNLERQKSLGITEALWQTSTCGMKPGIYPEHVEYNDRRYSLLTGLPVDGKYLHPGTEIGCTCISRSVIPGFVTTN